MNPDTLLTAIKAALTPEGEDAPSVAFVPHVPNAYTVPSVIVAPGDPFLVTVAHGYIEERWDVLVVFSALAPDKGVGLFRDVSLKIRQAVARAGGRWERTTGPRLTDDDNTLLVANEIAFKYDPSQE